MRKIDLTGQRFGKLVIIKKTDERNIVGCIYWLCKCDCGSMIKADTHNLKRGHKKSCGCLKKEIKTNIYEIPDKQKCTKCGEIKNIDDFNWRIKNKRKHRWCKKCHVNTVKMRQNNIFYRKKQYRKNKEKELLRNKKYRESNREKIKIRRAKYRELHRMDLKLKSKIYRNNLIDSYIKQIIKARFNIDNIKISSSLIESYKVQIIAKRRLRDARS